MLFRSGDPKKYRLALEKFHAVHGCTVQPVPKEITFSVLDQILGDRETGEGGDPTVSMAMCVIVISLYFQFVLSIVTGLAVRFRDGL